MKSISHKDLCMLIPLFPNMECWDLSDFERLLDEYGDDWYAEGERFKLVTENERMKEIRKYLEEHSHD